MTLVLKSGKSFVNFFSMESIARALSRSCDIVFLRKVLILFKVDNHLSDSDVVSGVVMMMFRRLTVSVNVSPRLFSFKT